MRAARWLVAVALAAACTGTPASRREVAGAVRPRAGPCADLAYTFRLVAERRDERVTRRAQRRLARTSLDTPFVTDYDRALADLYRVIDLAYESEDLSPADIEESVRARCRQDADGRAVLSGPWGAPVPER